MEGSRLFSVVLQNKSGNGQKLVHRKCHLNMRKNFTVQVPEHWSSPERLGRYSLEIFHKGLDATLCYVLRVPA